VELPWVAVQPRLDSPRDSPRDLLQGWRLDWPPGWQRGWLLAGPLVTDWARPPRLGSLLDSRRLARWSASAPLVPRSVPARPRACSP
jgi:hypothetical protein